VSQQVAFTLSKAGEDAGGIDAIDGSISVGTDNETFRVGKALKDGNGYILAEHPTVIAFLSSDENFKQVSAKEAEEGKPKRRSTRGGSSRGSGGSRAKRGSRSPRASSSHGGSSTQGQDGTRATPDDAGVGQSAPADRAQAQGSQDTGGATTPETERTRVSEGGEG